MISFHPDLLPIGESFLFPDRNLNFLLVNQKAAGCKCLGPMCGRDSDQHTCLGRTHFSKFMEQAYALDRPLAVRCVYQPVHLFERHRFITLIGQRQGFSFSGPLPRGSDKYGDPACTGRRKVAPGVCVIPQPPLTGVMMATSSPS